MTEKQIEQAKEECRKEAYRSIHKVVANDLDINHYNFYDRLTDDQIDALKGLFPLHKFSNCITQGMNILIAFRWQYNVSYLFGYDSLCKYMARMSVLNSIKEDDEEI